MGTICKSPPNKQAVRPSLEGPSSPHNLPCISVFHNYLQQSVSPIAVTQRSRGRGPEEGEGGGMGECGFVLIATESPPET